MSNHLQNQTSPYLLQHKDNPVDWYPWGEEAFTRAKQEDKPIFLSIGYSTCHWCHVMAHESFEEEETAEFLNEHFISIKVDKEERPDIDNIYMAFCQAFTGSGGWPMSIFMTPDQHPFMAGTYYPNTSRYGMRSFMELLHAIADGWANNREPLIQSAKEVVSALQQTISEEGYARAGHSAEEQDDSKRQQLFTKADNIFIRSFDPEYGGFGMAPKFPTPHKLLYLLASYERNRNRELLDIVDKTLTQMYRGGLFDHIGFGFSRYSTDERFLAPHFEKMLYDNALLILAYSKAYEITGKQLFLDIAEKTGEYVLTEMTDEEGGFYCAQDADVEGQEGLYYLLTPKETIGVLGEAQGNLYNHRYDVTYEGNFEGKNIPNLLKTPEYEEQFAYQRESLYEYRKQRYQLHLDDKILTSWNGLMIGALCWLYRVSKKQKYLDAAKSAQRFIEENLMEENLIEEKQLDSDSLDQETSDQNQKKQTNLNLYVSYRKGTRGNRGFLDDYANEIFAMLCLYDATLDPVYAQKAEVMVQKVNAEFLDSDMGAYYLYGQEHETLILRPKETYDGAIPSGNSMMAYDLVRLCLMAEDSEIELTKVRDRQLVYMAAQAESDPSSYAMYLYALLLQEDAPEKVVVVPEPGSQEQLSIELPLKVALDSVVRILPGETDGFRLKENKTTYYVCKGHQCLAGSNTLEQ